MTYEPLVTPKLRKKLLAYEALRDDGMMPVDAAREIGVGWDRGHAFERWYRDRRGLSRRVPNQRRYPEELKNDKGLLY